MTLKHLLSMLSLGIVLYAANGGTLRAVGYGAISGRETTWTRVDLSPWVPPTATLVLLNAVLSFIHSSPITLDAFWRPCGSTLQEGVTLSTMTSQVSYLRADSMRQVWVGRCMEYRLNVQPDVEGGLFLDVVGYQE